MPDTVPAPRDAQRLPTCVPGSHAERRVHTRLRSIFDGALALVEPFFDPERAWAGVCLEHFAYRALREHYPDLTAGEVYVFVVAARRIYAARTGSRRRR